jgi:hypothetical protein
MPGMRPPFGGPIGPVSHHSASTGHKADKQNVGPHPRRPGFFPPGVPGASGDYGLPAASRYGPAGPPRPVGHPEPDSGLGLTDNDSTPSTATTQLITPLTSDKHLDIDVHTGTPTVSFSCLCVDSS